MAEQTFGERLARLRENKGWLQRDLGARIDVKANTISNWEKGISRPNLDQLCQLCQALGVSSDILLGLDARGMEESLSFFERNVIRTLRTVNPQMRNSITQMISAVNTMHGKLFTANATLMRAEEFIEGAGMKDDWEDLKKEELNWDASESDDDDDSDEEISCQSDPDEDTDPQSDNTDN